MGDTLQKGDRLLIIDHEYNPLTEFNFEGVDGDSFRVTFSYGIFVGTANYPSWKVSRHPIQKSQFTFSVEILGNQCSANNPKINDYSKYLVQMNNAALIYRAGLICLKQILKSFTDEQSKIDAKEELTQILNSEDVLLSLNNFIVPVINSFPKEFECKSVLEYSGEFTPVIAIYNSDKRNNNIVTAIFFILYTVLLNQIGVLSKDSIMKELNY